MHRAGQETNEQGTAWPSVSLLILNWNGRALLESCIPPLLHLDYPEYEVIVADNGSTDDSVPYVREHFPAVRIIEIGENLGFSRGMNVGLRRTEAGVVVILNNDVVVPEKAWLRHLVRPLTEDDEIGISGGKLLFPDRQTIQHAGAFLTEPLAYSRHTGHGEIDEGQHDEARDVPYVTGAAMAIARRVLDEIGLFDEQFTPFYYEEVDFCWRARAAGYRVRYVPEAWAIHDESFSLRRATRLQYYTYHRNRLRFVLKHYSARHFLESFVPAEEERLRQTVSEKLIPLERQIYLEALHELPQIGEDGKSERLRAALLGLRRDALARGETGPDPQTERLAALAQQKTMDEFRFSSQIPLIGPLIALFREQWHNVAGKWAVRHLRQQQQRFNHLLLKLLERQAMVDGARDDQIYSNAADIDTLLQEVMALRRDLEARVAELEKTATEIDRRLGQLERRTAEREQEDLTERVARTGEN